jgi:hypothetical protein
MQHVRRRLRLIDRGDSPRLRKPIAYYLCPRLARQVEPDLNKRTAAIGPEWQVVNFAYHRDLAGFAC